MQIHTDVSLRGLNTLGLNAKCSAFARVESDAEIPAVLAESRARSLPLIVLGEGSNVVLAGPVKALVLQQASKGIELLEDTPQSVLLRVSAGENWHQFVGYCLQQGYYGLENLALIPGTVGAAPIQNIGAYGAELASFVSAVHAHHIEDCSMLTLSGTECEFGYRDSVFKHRLRDRVVITAVDLRLSRVAQPNTCYPALQAALNERGCTAPEPRDIYETVIAVRTEKLPNPDIEPNAGSFFKNPVLDEEGAKVLVSRFPGLPCYPQPDGSVKLPAAWLIDYCGWKGYREQGVGVHDQHALVLINCGSEDGSPLLALAEKIAATVLETFGVDLEMEPRVYGCVDD